MLKRQSPKWKIIPKIQLNNRIREYLNVTYRNQFSVNKTNNMFLCQTPCCITVVLMFTFLRSAFHSCLHILSTVTSPYSIILNIKLCPRIVILFCNRNKVVSDWLINYALLQPFLIDFTRFTSFLHVPLLYFVLLHILIFQRTWLIYM